ncbi:MAG: DUF6056 family protein [Chloroflexota bacterium]|nr:DUF6056 family protein [Chloroflexota bacterium]
MKADAGARAAWLAAALALAPVALFAYLGHFSRMMGDDWGHFATAQQLGGADYFQFWWAQRYSSYTYILLHKALAPMGPEIMPQVFPAAIIALWLLSLAWLIAAILRILQIERNRRPVSVALAALLLTATLNSLYTWESIYWYSASVRYALPVALFILYIAFAIDGASRGRTSSGAVAVALGGAVLCFLNAGFSEMQLVIQLVFLSCMLAGVFAFKGGRARGRMLAQIAAGWGGTVISLLLQLTSPAISTRMHDGSSLGERVPLRSLGTLIAETVETAVAYLGDAGTVAGFSLMLLLGLTISLLMAQPRQRGKAEAKGLALAAFLALASALLALILPVATGLYSIGIVYPRLMVSSVFAQIIAGVVFGACVGCMIKSSFHNLDGAAVWYSPVTKIGAAVVACYTLAVVITQVSLISDFSLYAREWDARHQRIIELRESGANNIEVPPYTFDMTAYIAANKEPIRGSDAYFYGVDAIVETRS